MQTLNPITLMDAILAVTLRNQSPHQGQNALPLGSVEDLSGVAHAAPVDRGYCAEAPLPVVSPPAHTALSFDDGSENLSAQNLPDPDCITFHHSDKYPMGEAHLTCTNHRMEQVEVVAQLQFIQGEGLYVHDAVTLDGVSYPLSEADEERIAAKFWRDRERE